MAWATRRNLWVMSQNTILLNVILLWAQHNLSLSLSLNMTLTSLSCFQNHLTMAEVSICLPSTQCLLLVTQALWNMTDVFDQVKVLMTTSEVSRHQQIGLWMKTQASKFSFFLNLLAPLTWKKKEKEKKNKKPRIWHARQNLLNSVWFSLYITMATHLFSLVN